MNSDPSFNHADLTLEEHLHSVCLDLDRRIARLAISLGLSLDERIDMARLLHHVSLLGESHTRTEHLWQELRGLVLMRDQLELRCVNLLGAASAGQILLEIENEMKREGFPPQVDGMDLHRLLDLKVGS